MTKSAKNTTELVFILDKSGSMGGLEGDTIGGFNAMIEKQKKTAGECYITTVMFNSSCDTVHDRITLEKINPITDKEYSVGGCTALIDAIGQTIEHISDIHKYARPEDIPEKTLFIITTDGLENASHIYSSKKVKAMIKAKQEESGWEFLFIGANIDSVETASSLGISEDRAVNYHADKLGTAMLYEAVSDTVCMAREQKKISSGWSKKIKKDYEQRKQ